MARPVAQIGYETMLALTYIIPAVLIGAGVALWLWRRHETWRAERLIKGAVAEAWARTPKVTPDPDNPGCCPILRASVLRRLTVCPNLARQLHARSGLYFGPDGERISPSGI